ncbi:MAG TPA: peptidase MA family metallohydrolase [Anaerolineales bacterium]|nr:peptidase MA family metallohydrolase [Anaerolineales bacterium]
MEGDQNTRTVPLAIAGDGSIDYTYSIQSGLLRPFSHVFFWYHITPNNGNSFDSSRYFFEYTDNRYPWQVVENSGIRVHWYTGDLAFGQDALNTALAGYQAIQALIPTTSTDPINIYIYASPEDVQNTLNLGGYTWVGGHASPDLGVVLVSIAPGDTQSIEMERQIPHELAHVLLYRQIGAAYAKLPTWLLEGIASQVEQYPNSDYTQVLTVSAVSGKLIPITDLCGPFPMDASGAILAYAESDDFVHFLIANYGSTSIRALIQVYSDGLACDEGAARAVGAPLSQLDSEWQKTSLKNRGTGSGVSNFLPYLAVLLLVLILPAWRLVLNLRKKGDQ